MSSSSPARLQRQKAFVEIGGRDLPRTVGTLGDVRGPERQRGRRQVAGRVGMGDRAADRATVADRGIPDVARRVGEQRDMLGEQRRRLDVAVPRERTDGDVVAGVADVREVGDPADVDEHGRLSEAQLHQRQQAVPAGKKLGVVAVLAGEADRLLGARRPDIVERGGDHCDLLASLGWCGGGSCGDTRVFAEVRRCRVGVRRALFRGSPSRRSTGSPASARRSRRGRRGRRRWR